MLVGDSWTTEPTRERVTHAKGLAQKAQILRGGRAAGGSFIRDLLSPVCAHARALTSWV